MRAEYREEPCVTALNRVTGMGFQWSLNPYTGCAHRCAFCYVRAFEARADRPGDDRYGTSIRVKVNVAEVLERELARRSWMRDSVAVGAATDPYQPAEARYRLTRRCIEAFARARNPFSIVTRGPLVVRDIDVLAEASRRAQVNVNLSVPTLDERVWRATEPATAPPRQRLRAVSMLVRAGIRAGVAIAPLLPGISDRPDQLETLVRAAREAGATHVWAGMVHLKSAARDHFFAALGREWPELLPEYERLFDDGAYLPRAVSEPTLERMRALRDRFGIADRREIRLAPPPEPAQMLLPV
ncbi:MAG: radical SAM protein [Candidatus Eisenbacteria bacterium]